MVTEIIVETRNISSRNKIRHLNFISIGTVIHFLEIFSLKAENLCPVLTRTIFQIGTIN